MPAEYIHSASQRCSDIFNNMNVYEISTHHKKNRLQGGVIQTLVRGPLVDRGCPIDGPQNYIVHTVLYDML